MMKLAIVTGSEGGIGRAICEKLRHDSYRIVGIDIVEPQNEKHYEHFFQGSVADETIVSKSFSAAQDLNVSNLLLVNNAGITLPKNESIEAWAKTIEINLTGPYIWMLAAANYFELTKISGSIISITSLASELAFPDNHPYAAAKGGLKQLTKSFAYRLGPLGICCNNLVPGYIETQFNSNSLKDSEKYKKRAERSLLNRWGQAKEIAEVVQFLSSNGSRFITGQDIIVDGGWTVQGLREN
jgi:gluconate 5-dehydrogenase